MRIAKCIAFFVVEDKLNIPKNKLEDKLGEIRSLINTLGWKAYEVASIKAKRLDPAFYITRGKVEYIKSLPYLSEVDYIIFYNDLSPVHIRNLENELGKKVLTKVDLVLMIFKEHAVSMEAKLQVELASLMVELPRLYGIGKGMEQIKGGIGLRGPGERRTEVMKRHIKEKIRVLKSRIEEIKKHRRNQLKLRRSMFNISIVGYTNSGKSTLMNYLTKAGVLEEDKLFSTLDTKTKKIYIDGLIMTITDTVGFIEDIPPQLVEAFYSTLEVVKVSDLLLHVVDITSNFIDDKIASVNNVLKTIFKADGAEIPELLYVFNKIDLLKDVDVIRELEEKYPNSVFISAKEGINIRELRRRLVEIARNASKCRV